MSTQNAREGMRERNGLLIGSALAKRAHKHGEKQQDEANGNSFPAGERYSTKPHMRLSTGE